MVEANVFRGNHTLDRTLEDVLAQRGDVVVVTEASPRAERGLRGAYPYEILSGAEAEGEEYWWANSLAASPIFNSSVFSSAG